MERPAFGLPPGPVPHIDLVGPVLLVVVAATLFVLVSRSELLGLTTEQLSADPFSSADRWLVLRGVLLPIAAIGCVAVARRRMSDEWTLFGFALLLPVMDDGIATMQVVLERTIADGLSPLSGLWTWLIPFVLGTIAALIGLAWSTTRLQILQLRNAPLTPALVIALLGVAIALSSFASTVTRILAAGDGIWFALRVASGAIPLLVLAVALWFGGRGGARFAMVAASVLLVVSVERTMLIRGDWQVQELAPDLLAPLMIVIGAWLVARTPEVRRPRSPFDLAPR